MRQLFFRGIQFLIVAFYLIFNLNPGRPGRQITQLRKETNRPFQTIADAPITSKTA